MTLPLYFLRFDSEQQAADVLADYGLIGDNGEFLTQNDYAILDVIGLIGDTQLVGSPDDGGVAVLTPVPGFHINIGTNELPVGLQSYEVFPATPRRVFL